MTIGTKLPRPGRGGWPVPDMDRMNRHYTAAAGLAFGAAGSGGTILVWAALVWAVVRLLQRRIRLAAPPAILWLSLFAVLWWLSAVLMAAGNLDDRANQWLILERLVGAGFILFYARQALSSPKDVLSSLFTAGALGGLASGLWALAETGFLGVDRAEGAPGNQGPFATVAAVMFALSLAGALHSDPSSDNRSKLLHAAGALAAAFAIVASGMRTMMPALILIPVVLLLLHPRRGAIMTRRNLSVGLAAVAFLALVGGSTVATRFATLATDIAASGLNPNPATSLGQRIAIWQCGIDALPGHWLAGDGRADAQKALAACTKALTGTTLRVTHFHNAALNALLYGGVLELIAVAGLLLAPLLVLSGSGRHSRPETRTGMALTVAMVMIYGLNGAMNLMFGHDILDALYVYFVAAALSVARPDEPGTGAAPG